MLSLKKRARGGPPKKDENLVDKMIEKKVKSLPNFCIRGQKKSHWSKKADLLSSGCPLFGRKMKISNLFFNLQKITLKYLTT